MTEERGKVPVKTKAKRSFFCSNSYFGINKLHFPISKPWSFALMLGTILACVYCLMNFSIGTSIFDSTHNLIGNETFSRPFYTECSEDTLVINKSFHVALDIEAMKQNQVVIYNRLPKCGSSTMNALISQMSTINSFHYYHSKIFGERYLSEERQKHLVNTLVRQNKTPFVFDRHVAFLNFSHFGYDMPVYMNLVRDPVERLVSKFYYLRHTRENQWPKSRLELSINQCVEKNITECIEFSTKTEGFILIPFFCGHDAHCLVPSRLALQTAMRNAVNYYAVVGLLEDLPRFLKVLEIILPQFFKDVSSKVFAKPSFKRYNSAPRPEQITEANRARLMEIFALEYEFYDFLKGRFEDLFTKLI